METHITTDLSNNVIVKESSGNSYLVNGLKFIVGEKKIKKIPTKKVKPICYETIS
jgi:hypothetical protein